METEQNNSQIITFYSYKGGCGRTMALANIACILALKKNYKPILVIDWDLEAPGLHLYFDKHMAFNLEYKDKNKHPGLIDLFIQIKKKIDSKKNIYADLHEYAKSIIEEVHVEHYIQKTIINDNLYILKAGLFNKEYANRVNIFDWKKLFKKCPEIFVAFGEYLKERYSYILIDSRTGYTDIGGICTSLLPEKLIAVFTPNNQSLYGLYDVINSALEYRRRSVDTRQLVIYPLPSRIENSEPTLRKKWKRGDKSLGIVGYQNIFEKQFTKLYGLKECNLNAYFNEVQIQHVPRFAFGEEISVLMEESDRLSLARSYESFCDWLTNHPAPWSTINHPITNIPRRNPNFTGREQLLLHIKKLQIIEHDTTLTQQVLFGLGGIGKSQLALEYAHRSLESFDVVWWIQAKEPASLSSDYAALAQELNLPEKNATEHEIVIRAVRKWLNNNSKWLLVFDNAQDYGSLSEYLPQTSSGQILLTSRNHDWRAFCLSPIEVMTLQRKESLAFLQQRTRKIDPEKFNALADMLGDLPLALEQAAAYIETTQITINEYITFYKTRRNELWKIESGPFDHQQSVAVTFGLSIEDAEKIDPLSGLVLHLCAVIAPNNIPRPLIRACGNWLKNGGNKLLDDLSFNNTIGTLCNYSLIRADSDNIYLHQLVQAVDTYRMGDKETAQYSETMVKALSSLFPAEAHRDPSCWPECEKLLPHATTLIDNLQNDDAVWQEIALLLNNIASYLRARAAYSKAEPMYRRALEIRKKYLGNDNPLVAQSLNNLAVLLRIMGRYTNVEHFFRQALAIRESMLGNDHPDVAQSLNNLASFLRVQGKIAEAKPMFKHALKIRESKLGSNHPDVAQSLNNLAGLLELQKNYSEAEPMYRRALAINEKKLGSMHPDVAQSLNNLAGLLKAKGKYAEAEPMYRRALAINEKSGNMHPDVAQSLNNLAGLLLAKGKYADAETLFRQALAISEKTLGKKHSFSIAVKKKIDDLIAIKEKKKKIR